MKENYDNLGLIIYFFNGQDAGNNLYIFLTDMKTLIFFHFVSSTNIGQILNKVDFFTVLPFFNSIILIIAISFAIPIIQRILCSRFDWTKKMSFWSKSILLFLKTWCFLLNICYIYLKPMWQKSHQCFCRIGN